MSDPVQPLAHADEDAEFAERLRAARDERGFTQGAVALRTKGIDPEGRGISRTAIIAYEQGSTKPGIRELRLICEVLHVTPNWLIYGTDSAAKASLASLELVDSQKAGLRDVLALSLAILSLKGHERDSLLTLALSLAGRQLGDVRLSATMSWVHAMKDKFFDALRSDFPEGFEGMTLEQLGELIADNGLITNGGNRFRLDEEGEILNPEAATYPEPTREKVANPDNNKN